VTDTEIVERAADGAVDRRGRRLVWVCVAFALAGLVALAAAFFLSRVEQDQALVELGERADDNARAAQLLAEQVTRLGADPVVDPPAVDAPDPDDPERQDPEVQDPEIQDPEQQQPERQDPETPDVEQDDPDPDDPEIQDEEIQDPEVDDPPATGPPGPPPASWTWTDTAGRQQSCTRSGGPDTAPTYTCTAEPPPETVPGRPLLPIGG
jgi:outer membrane biosynthesis protein TonB